MLIDILCWLCLFVFGFIIPICIAVHLYKRDKYDNFFDFIGLFLWGVALEVLAVTIVACSPILALFWIMYKIFVETK